MSALRFGPREVVVFAVLGALLLSGGVMAFVRARPVAAGSVPAITAPTDGPSAATTTIVVHIVGAVRDPGVYEFPEGARVVEAVRAAGGFTRKADAAAVNLARALADGEQVVVPERGSGNAPTASGTTGTTGSTGTTGTQVNINLASTSELETLPGIGPVIAQRIIEYREQHGPFRTTADLQKVSGIGPKTFESIEPYVTV